ncbi:MAG: GldG family protein [Myxococcota bacterium]
MNTTQILATACMLGSIVLVNLLSVGHFVRLDLTQDSKYTLADASRKTMQTLQDVMVVQAYFSRDLPSPYASYARYARDLLEEYRVVSDGQFTFTFTDPAAEKTHEDHVKHQQAQQDVFGRTMHVPTRAELDLAQLGIQPAQVRVIEDDAQKLKQIYMGIVVRYQGRHETIPFVQDMGNLEKDLTVLMRKLTQDAQPVLGILDAHAGMRTNKFRQLIAPSVQVKQLNLHHLDSLHDIDALLFMGKPQDVPMQAIQAIEAFLAGGRNAVFLLDPFHVNLNTLTASYVLPQQEEQQGLYALLHRYGVRLGHQLVTDVQCANIPVQEQMGSRVAARSVPYPFIPDVSDFHAEHPITHKLQGVLWPFAAEVSTQDVPNSLSATILAHSSDKSWLESEPFDINPQRNWNAVNISPSGSHGLLLELKGKFLPEEISPEGESIDTNLAKIVVAGTSALVQDSFLETKANANLALNLIDSMVADEDVLRMRTRDFIDVPLRQDLNSVDRRALKYGNIVGAPLFLILIGLFRWSLRELYRKTIRTKLLDPGKRNKRDPSILL